MLPDKFKRHNTIFHDNKKQAFTCDSQELVKKYKQIIVIFHYERYAKTLKMPNKIIFVHLLKIFESMHAPLVKASLIHPKWIINDERALLKLYPPFDVSLSN